MHQPPVWLVSGIKKPFRNVARPEGQWRSPGDTVGKLARGVTGEPFAISLRIDQIRRLRHERYSLPARRLPCAGAAECKNLSRKALRRIERVARRKDAGATPAPQNADVTRVVVRPFRLRGGIALRNTLAAFVQAYGSSACTSSAGAGPASRPRASSPCTSSLASAAARSAEPRCSRATAKAARGASAGA